MFGQKLAGPGVTPVSLQCHSSVDTMDVTGWQDGADGTVRWRMSINPIRALHRRVRSQKMCCLWTMTDNLWQTLTKPTLLVYLFISTLFVKWNEPRSTLYKYLDVIDAWSKSFLMFVIFLYSFFCSFLTYSLKALVFHLSADNSSRTGKDGDNRVK